MIEPLYNLVSFAKGKDLSLTPLYNVLIKGRCLSFIFNLKSLFTSL